MKPFANSAELKNKKEIKLTEENFIKIDKQLAKKLLPERPQNSNKGTFGTVLNIAGSSYYSGAAYLSSVAALKIGAGLMRLASESETISRISVMLPDATLVDLGENEYGTIPKNAMKTLKNINNPSAISIGCGLTTFPPVKEFVLKFLKEYIDSSIPIIIDADAINILAEEKNKLIPLNSAITPHPLELSRLIDVEVKEIQADRVKWAEYASKNLDCIVVLKGKNTVISIPNGKTFVNTTGNSSLAKGGSGDVLTGMITGLTSQGLKLEDACVLGCYLHGLAGELASIKLTEYSVLSSNLIDYIPYAIRELYG